MTKTRNRLLLRSLKFVSLVDRPANEHSLAIVKRAGEPDHIDATCRVVKVEPTLGIVLGFANCSTVDGEGWLDSQGDVTDETDLVKVCAEYAEAGAAVDQMHDEQPVDGARTVFLFPLTSGIADELGMGPVGKTGILIGVKLPPAELAKFTGPNPSYTGFSIGGTGEREPLEKSADADDRLAKHRADLEAQAAKMLADREYEVRIVKDSCEWLDSLAAEGRVDFAKSIADKNRTSCGNWGQVWMDRQAGIVEKGATFDAPEEILKSADKFDAFMKSATSDIEKALGTFNAKQAEYVKGDTTRNINTFMATDEGRDLYGKYHEAQIRALSGNGDAIAKSHTTRIEALSADIAKEVEAFATHHAMDIGKAAEQLKRSSPTHAKKCDELAKAYTDRAIAANDAQALADRWIAEDAQKRNDAVRIDLEKQMEARRTRSMTPSERRLDARIGELMQTQKMARPAATAWALTNDPIAKTLYEVATEERTATVR